jgi:hypothetical protein
MQQTITEELLPSTSDMATQTHNNHVLTKEHNINLNSLAHEGFYQKHIRKYITLNNTIKFLALMDALALLCPVSYFIWQESLHSEMALQWIKMDSIALGCFAFFSFCILAITILRQKSVQTKLRKIKNWFAKHQTPILVIIAIGVALGESAPVYYFITSLKDNPKFASFLIHNHLLTCLTVFGIAATFSAFILSFALFYKSMEDTVNAAKGIFELITKGYTRHADSDGNLKTLNLFARFLLLISVFFCLFSAAVCGALAANSILGSFGSTSFVYAAAITVFFFEIIATTCVNYVFFGQTLVDAFDRLWKRFLEYNKKLTGIEDSDSFGMKMLKSTWALMFWGLFLPLCAFTGYICSELFYNQLKNFSLCKINTQWVLVITIGAMIVNCVFRFKSIFDLLDYAFNFREKQKGPAAMRLSKTDKKAKRYKKLGFLLLDFLLLGMLGIMSPLLNGSGQGFGAFSMDKATLPKSLGGFLSSDFCLWCCFVGITLASSGANALAYFKMLNKNDSVNKFRGLDNPDSNSNKSLKLFTYNEGTKSDLIISEPENYNQYYRVSVRAVPLKITF